MFELKARCGLGRLGVVHTPHGTIVTPTILPVINPHFMPLHPDEMRAMGAQAIITNSYIIHRDEALRERALAEGLHSLLNFTGPIMTDSGSFQMYMYGAAIDSMDIVRFQRDIGSDIGTILDIFSEDGEYETVSEEVEATIKRAKESVKEKGDMLLACTVQGGTYSDLRRKCARNLAKLAADVHPIGGVVPLMEKQRYAELAGIIIASKKELPPSRPVHLFGAGHPLIFPMAVALGCDLFDSASYIKYAKDDRLIFSEKTMRLSELDELPCCCPVCSAISVDALKHMEKEERTAAIARHNLWQTFAEMRRIRQAIHHGTLWELVEQRATAHPALLEAMEIIAREKKWLERWENISGRRAFLYTGKYSVHRPLVYRLQKRVAERYEPFFEHTIIFAECGKPYSRNTWMCHLEANVIIESPFGPIPLELDEIYPVPQSLFPSRCDAETEREMKRAGRKLHQKLPPAVGLEEVGRESSDFDIRKIKSIANYQFGKGAGAALFAGDVAIIKSKSTGKIRNILCDGEHVASLRASDGFFSLKAAGGRRLHAFFTPPTMRVVIADDAIPFVREGKNVFAKFVVACGKELRPYDEVLIVNGNDEFLATGQCILNREEMLSFQRGIAVKTRDVL